MTPDDPPPPEVPPNLPPPRVPAPPAPALPAVPVRAVPAHPDWAPPVAGPHQPADRAPAGTFAPLVAPIPTGTNGKATAALVLGIAGLLICPLVCSLLAIILGQQAKHEIRRTGQHGEGSAKAGFVLGIIGTAFGVLIVLVYLVIVAVAISSDPSSLSTTD